jgi:predicted AAA+ superfamily ATPase
MSLTKLEQLLNRLEHLAKRAEHFFPEIPETNWNAIAYRWRKPGYMESVKEPHGIFLRDLQHIDRQKNALDRNTRKFLSGLPANHALLWGSRGTGKSSLVKALLQEYATDGLRLVEVDKQDLINLPDIIDCLSSRAERYILFSDDLSFGPDDPSYKTLKAALDGSVVAAPRNILVYATSNRRHLIPEHMQDNLDAKHYKGELHHSEAVEEKISLSERFGLWLSFYAFNQREYLGVIEYWRIRLKVKVRNRQDMEKAALQFALYRGSRSGRVARQFVNHWATEPDV